LCCDGGAPVSPEAVYRSIEQRFISGDLARADAESRRASSLAEASGPLWAAKFRLLQARIWVYQGHYTDAVALLKQKLPATSDLPLAITRSTLLSIAYRRTGDPAHATQSLSDAEKLCPDELACAEVRQAQGIINIENAQLADAKRAFELCLISARRRGDDFLQMQVLLNLGVVTLRQEHYDEALDRFAAASVLANAIGARVALEKATGNVGWALYKLGDYRRALANSQLAEQQAATLGVPIDQANWLNDAGLSQSRLGDLTAAKSSYERSLLLAQTIHNSEETSDALVALASLSLQMGNLGDALKRAREAQQIAEQRGNESDTLRPALIEALVMEKQGDISAAKNQLASLQLRSSAKPSIRWEVENALAQLSASVGDEPAASIWFRRAIETYRSQRFSVTNINSRLPFVENGTTLYLSYMEYLIHEGQIEDALNIFDQSHAETLAEGLEGLVAPPTLHPSALARRLNATILVYCLRPGTSYLWAIGPRRMDFLRLPGKEVILPLIDSHTRFILSSKDVLSHTNSPGFSLYRHLVEPVSSFIAPGGKVFVIADEGMNGLNFETLVTSSEHPHFWIEDANILNARSLSLLAGSHSTSQSSTSPKRLLLIGDPLNKRREYEKLPYAGEEVASIAKHFSPTQRLVLTGADATPAAYRLSKPVGFSYIHFVAHGVASNISPLDSAVILSAPADSAESYKLYAREILDQKLQADLVTISSCYGSGTRSYAGEGLVGLTWAFLRAGSHNVVGALWEVSDVSTPRLMNDLYDGLARGENPATALRSAKLAMIRGGGVFRKPFYWAPFQLYAGT
jgi:tetratricopeptide (TPR) repeat protein